MCSLRTVLLVEYFSFVALILLRIEDEDEIKAPTFL
jgi:hypothetical protein